MAANEIEAQSPSRIIDEELILVATNSSKVFLIELLSLFTNMGASKKIAEPVNLQPQRSP